jgi:hypothetical protein
MTTLPLNQHRTAPFMSTPPHAPARRSCNYHSKPSWAHSDAILAS